MYQIKSSTPSKQPSEKILKPINFKSSKRVSKNKKQKRRKTKSIHNIEDLLSRKRTSTQKKIRLYNSKIKTLQGKSDVEEVKHLLQTEWRKIKKEGKLK